MPAINSSGVKKSPEYAPGIPERSQYGKPLRDLTAGDIVEYVLQHHQTTRNPKVPHYDLRLGTPATRMYSWAVPKAELPDPGKSKPVFQTFLHNPSYNKFEGRIGRGYGEGLVTRADLGKANITKVTPKTLHFALTHVKPSPHYTLIHTGGRDGRSWLLRAKQEPKGMDEKHAGVNVKDIVAALEAMPRAKQIKATISPLASKIRSMAETLAGQHGYVDPASPFWLAPWLPAPDIVAKAAKKTDSTLEISNYFKDLAGRIIKQDKGVLPDDFIYKQSADSVRMQFMSKTGELKKEATIEIADTPALRRVGLQHRRFLADDHGMFFDKVGSYWMKDVHFPLEIVFIDQYGTILEKQSMAVNLQGSAIYTPRVKAAHAIELPGGWCDRHDIKVGDSVQACNQ